MDCQDIHRHVTDHDTVHQHGTRKRYYRFNVDSGLKDIELDEYDKIKKISDNTEGYLDDPDRRSLLDDCISLLSSDEELLENVLGQ
jgi:hypothetical protein